MMKRELKPCPFCGCDMKVQVDKYPNGDKRMEPDGWHFDGCILNDVMWHLYDEDGWTEEKIAEAWNRRAEDDD